MKVKTRFDRDDYYFKRNSGLKQQDFEQPNDRFIDAVIFVVSILAVVVLVML